MAEKKIFSEYDKMDKKEDSRKYKKLEGARKYKNIEKLHAYPDDKTAVKEVIPPSIKGKNARKKLREEMKEFKK